MGDDGFRRGLGQIDDGEALVAGRAGAPEIFDDGRGGVFFAAKDQIVADAGGFQILRSLARLLVDQLEPLSGFGFHVNAGAAGERGNFVAGHFFDDKSHSVHLTKTRRAARRGMRRAAAILLSIV